MIYFYSRDNNDLFLLSGDNEITEHSQLLESRSASNCNNSPKACKKATCNPFRSIREEEYLPNRETRNGHVRLSRLQAEIPRRTRVRRREGRTRDTRWKSINLIDVHGSTNAREQKGKKGERER